MSSCVVAVDVGGTTMKGSLIDELGRSHRLRTRPSKTGRDTVTGLRAMLQELAAAAADDKMVVAGAGVVTPGVVDAAAGRVEFASNLDWRDVRLRDELQGQLGLPVAIDHDVRAAGRAEALLGEARGAGDVVFLPVGTGIAAAVVVGGRTVTGVGNAAGEVGHMPVHPRGELCACGQRGCLEAYASGAAIARRYRALGGAHALTAEQVAATIDSDPIARRVWSDAVEALALGSAIITMALDPAVIVLGGGLARAGDTLLGPLRSTLDGLLVWRRPPPIALSALGSAAGRIGAGIAAWDAVGRPATTEAWTRDVVLEACA